MPLIEINHNPPRSELRLFGGLWLPLALVIFGFSLQRRQPEAPWAWIAWASAVLACPLGWLTPSTFRWIYVGAMYLSFPIGWVVSHLLLACIFFGMITPLAWIMRSRGRDVLGLQFDRSAPTYWTPHAPVNDPARYFRQF